MKLCPRCLCRTSWRQELVMELTLYLMVDSKKRARERLETKYNLQGMLQ
jgi:hypothetical protein